MYRPKDYLKMSKYGGTVVSFEALLNQSLTLLDVRPDIPRVGTPYPRRRPGPRILSLTYPYN